MNRGTIGVNSLPKIVTRQRRACDFWTQALLRMSPAWVRFLVYNTGLVQYRWTGLDLLTADRVKMQDWKIVNSSKYSLSCCTYVFHRCRFVLAFSVLAFSVAPDGGLRVDRFDKFSSLESQLLDPTNTVVNLERSRSLVSAAAHPVQNLKPVCK